MKLGIVPVVCAAALAATLAASAGCGGSRLALPRDDPRYEFEYGRSEYTRKHWLEAQTHLKRFLDLHPGHAVADSAQYLLGMSKSGGGSFAEAAVEFGILAREFPRSPLRDDAAFQECRCYYEQMLPAALDPTFANRSMTCFREFLLRYPDSELRAAAEQQMLDIDDRLAEKDLRVGILFAKMNQPAAAQVYLQGLLQAHPRSRWVPDALLWLGRSHERRGDLAQAVATYRQLLGSFPDSNAAREARARERSLVDRHPELRAGTADPPVQP